MDDHNQDILGNITRDLSNEKVKEGIKSCLLFMGAYYASLVEGGVIQQHSKLLGEYRTRLLEAGFNSVEAYNIVMESDLVKMNTRGKQ